MMIGMPVVGLATTEMATVFRGSCASLVDTDVARLIKTMKALLEDPELAVRLGAAGKAIAAERFEINRFTQQWKDLFLSVVREKHQHAAVSMADLT